MRHTGAKEIQQVNLGGHDKQPKHLCVLIHIWIKGEVGAVKPV